MGRAQVAQLVEQRTENPRVGGSIPPLGTIFSQYYQQVPALKSCVLQQQTVAIAVQRYPQLHSFSFSPFATR
jgi:hypothetical protein